MVCFDCTPTWTRVLVHTHEAGPWQYPVPNLNLNLIRLEQTYSTCARTPRTKQHTKQTINLDDAVGLRSPLNKTSRPTSADNHPERLLSGEWETNFILNVNVRDHYSLGVITWLDTTHPRTHVRADRRQTPWPQLLAIPTTWPIDTSTNLTFWASVQLTINLKQRVIASVSSRSAVTDTCGHSRWCRLLAERAPRTNTALNLRTGAQRQQGRFQTKEYRRTLLFLNNWFYSDAQRLYTYFFGDGSLVSREPPTNY